MREHAVVIGNGRSRLNFDLHKIKDYLITYGCNALYRDFIPDYLISMDYHMVAEIINARAHHKCKFYTQHMNDFDLLAGNGEPINFVKHYISTPDSGTAALRLACDNNHIIIYMIGFDYHKNGFNNVYAGTANYASKSHSTPTSQDTSWKSRLHNLINTYSNVQFIRVIDEVYDGQKNNLTHISIEQFKEKYNGI